MRALILSCKTGGGHNACAKAIQEELESRNIEVTFLDPFSLKSEKSAENVGSLYVNMVRVAPLLFGFIYNCGDIYNNIFSRSPVYSFCKKNSIYLEEYLKNNHFDIIISTHLYPQLMLKALKEKGVSFKDIFVATDYECIPFANECNPNFYVIPSKQLVNRYIERKIDKDKLLPFGIPVARKFSEDYDIKNTISKLGLDPNYKYIMVSTGSIGNNCLHKIIKKILKIIKNKQIKIIVVCGNNKKIYDKLNNKYQNNNHLIFLFNCDICDYMKISNMYIGKPGGLSSSEILALGKTLYLYKAIPGVESRNYKYLLKEKQAYKFRYKDILKILDEDNKTNKMVKSDSYYASKRLGDFISNELNK